MSAVLKSVPKKRRTVSVCADAHVGYVSVNVDVDLREIDTDDLKAELDERIGNEGALLGIVNLQDIYQLMSAGKRDEAYEAMRTYLQDVLGRVLP